MSFFFVKHDVICLLSLFSPPLPKISDHVTSSLCIIGGCVTSYVHYQTKLYNKWDPLMGHLLTVQPFLPAFLLAIFYRSCEYVACFLYFLLLVKETKIILMPICSIYLQNENLNIDSTF